MIDNYRTFAAEKGHILLTELEDYENPAVVFDIDDTLIDSRTHKVIPSMLVLYNRVKRLGIPIFLITARDPSSRSYTVNQLRSVGVTGYKELFMVPNHEFHIKGKSKAKIRKKILSMGYTVFLNIGDDPTDFVDGGFIYGLRLPFLY